MRRKIILERRNKNRIFLITYIPRQATKGLLYKKLVWLRINQVMSISYHLATHMAGMDIEATHKAFVIRKGLLPTLISKAQYIG